MIDVDVCVVCCCHSCAVWDSDGDAAGGGVLVVAGAVVVDAMT